MRGGARAAATEGREAAPAETTAIGSATHKRRDEGRKSSAARAKTTDLAEQSGVAVEY